MSVKDFKSTASSKEKLLLTALLIGSLVYGVFDTPLFGNALAFIWWGNLMILFFWPKPKNLLA